MNRIEDEWHQLKTHEIVGCMFEDEYDLATAIMNGMKARSVQGGYILERFKFIFRLTTYSHTAYLRYQLPLTTPS
jgi:hypothetical protein